MDDLLPPLPISPLDGRLLACPICAKVGKKQILGKLLTNGDLIVLRFHHGTTIVKSPTFEVNCGCGYIFNISGTVITENYGKV